MATLAADLGSALKKAADKEQWEIVKGLLQQLQEISETAYVAEKSEQPEGPPN